MSEAKKATEDTVRAQKWLKGVHRGLLMATMHHGFNLGEEWAKVLAEYAEVETMALRERVAALEAERGWRAMETHPNDDGVSLFAILYSHGNYQEWSYHALYRDAAGYLREPSGDHFTDCGWDDLGFWMPLEEPKP